MNMKKIKIIIVDGNITYRNNLASKLRIDGYAVEFASGGFHLLHTLEIEKDFDLVIIHENMADMSAAEMISLIRTTKSKDELPVFFISNRSDELEIAKMISDGANEY
ncbi:MAG: response regulator, partial [Alphaproteobacteria bacterium]